MLASVPSRLATAERVGGYSEYLWQVERKKRRTGNVNHSRVAAGHELDVHGLPDTRGIDIPGECTLTTLLEDVAGTRSGRDNFSMHKGGASDESGEAGVCEHREE